jgi:hypothetical protein
MEWAPLHKISSTHRQMFHLRQPLTVSLILAWSDAHHARTGVLPKSTTADVQSLPPGECWRRLDQALRVGIRSLPGGDSLARLLQRQRGARNIHALPVLSEGEIMSWALAHRRRTGKWPDAKAGRIIGTHHEKWASVHRALRCGTRGLPGNDTLTRVLARAGIDARAIPRLTEQQVLLWADLHYEAIGTWPRATSGSVKAAPWENWRAISDALRLGLRGLPGGDTLPRLLVRHGRRDRLWQRGPGGATGDGRTTLMPHARFSMAGQVSQCLTNSHR